MNEIETAWVAGLLEGEGYFRATNASRGNPEPVVQLSMTDLDVIEKAKAILGVKTKIRFYDRRGQANYKEHHKPLHILWVRGYAAIRIMEAILPFMGARRAAKITDALNIWNSRAKRTRERGLPAICHPARPHYCGGLCRPCYSNRQYYKHKEVNNRKRRQRALLARMALADKSIQLGV